MGLLQLLFPPKCIICKDNIKKGTLCPFCAYKLDILKKCRTDSICVDGETVEITSLFPYENETVKSLLFALKRKGNADLFAYASDLYREAAGEMTGECVAVNVPRSRRNIAKYGYDHVAKPLKIMCKTVTGFVYAPLLKRKLVFFKTVDQKELDREGRRNNAKGKFFAVKKDIPRNILLADDVITTSSTASECIRQLRRVYPHCNIKCVFLASTGGDFPTV